MIYFVILIQLITALFVLVSPEPIRVATLGVFYNLFTIPQIGASLMLLAVVLSIIGLIVKSQSRFRFLFFLPQFIFLLLTSGSALSYVIQGQYADGVIRPWQFIFIDQIYPLVLLFLYTLSIFDFRKENTTNDVTEIREVI